VVDDEMQVGRMLGEMLQQLDYQVDLHQSAGFRTEPGQFAMLVTDMTMPQMTGLDLLRNYAAYAPISRPFVVPVPAS